jgi:hypothetical protein
MGGSNSIQDLSFDPSEWDEVVDQRRHEDDQFTVVRNRKTGQLLDRYQLIFPSEKEYNNYMDSVNYRRNVDGIVRVMHYEPKIIK